MKTCIEDLIPREDLQVFLRIERVVSNMPDIDLRTDATGDQVLVSCHMVARALARIFPEVYWEDGYFVRKGQRHSWLLLKRDPRLLIDPYPIGLLGGPIMVHAGLVTTPWERLYIKAKLNNLGGSPFRKHVNLVTKAMKSVL